MLAAVVDRARRRGNRDAVQRSFRRTGQSEPNAIGALEVSSVCIRYCFVGARGAGEGPGPVGKLLSHRRRVDDHDLHPRPQPRPPRRPQARPIGLGDEGVTGQMPPRPSTRASTRSARYTDQRMEGRDRRACTERAADGRSSLAAGRPEPRYLDRLIGSSPRHTGRSYWR